MMAQKQSLNSSPLKILGSGRVESTDESTTSYYILDDFFQEDVKVKRQLEGSQVSKPIFI